MPKKAPSGESIDPVRSMLAASVAAPPPIQTQQAPPNPVPAAKPSNRAVGEREHQAPPRHSVEIKPRVTQAVRYDPGAMRVAKKFLVTEGESDRIDTALDSIGQAFGSKVSYSQVSRALWTVLTLAEDAMAANPRRGEPLRRPSKGDALGMAEYEVEITDYLRVALKRT